jgi:hypothetical protein
LVSAAPWSAPRMSWSSDLAGLRQLAVPLSSHLDETNGKT